MNVSALSTHDVATEIVLDQPSWARACIGFTASICLIIVLPLMLVAI